MPPASHPAAFFSNEYTFQTYIDMVCLFPCVILTHITMMTSGNPHTRWDHILSENTCIYFTYIEWICNIMCRQEGIRGKSIDREPRREPKNMLVKPGMMDWHPSRDGRGMPRLWRRRELEKLSSSNKRASDSTWHYQPKNQIPLPRWGPTVACSCACWWRRRRLHFVIRI